MFTDNALTIFSSKHVRTKLLLKNVCAKLLPSIPLFLNSFWTVFIKKLLGQSLHFHLDLYVYKNVLVLIKITSASSTVVFKDTPFQNKPFVKHSLVNLFKVWKCISTQCIQEELSTQIFEIYLHLEAARLLFSICFPFGFERILS